MKKNYLTCLFFHLLLILFSSCGKQAEIFKIQQLEKEFGNAGDPEQKSELSNELHRLYSLYHLKYPGDTLFLLNWAEMAMRGKEFEVAKDCYDKLIKLNQGESSILLKRAAVHARLSLFGEASNDLFNAALAEDLVNKKEIHENGIYFQEVNSLLNHLNENIKNSIDIEGNLVERALLFLQNGKPSYAIHDIDRIIGVDSNYAAAYYAYAMLYYRTGEYKTAIHYLDAYFDNAGAKNPYREKAFQLERDLKFTFEINKCLEKKKEDPTSYNNLSELGKLYFKMKKYAEARTVFSEMIKHHPDSATGYIFRAQSYIQQSGLNPAMEDLKRALRVDSLNMSARNLKAYLFMLKNDTINMRREIEIIKKHDGELLDILPNEGY